MGDIHLTEAHEYVQGGVVYPSVTTILQAEGIIDTSWYDDQGVNRGTVVHEVTAMIDRGEVALKDFEDSDFYPYLEAYEWFRTDHQWAPTVIEHMFIAPNGAYAGTLDKAGELDGDTALIDVKTGSHQRWHGLQLAAYAYGANIADADRYILLLKKDGKYSLLDGHRTIGKFNDPFWDLAWNGILTTHLWKKGVFIGPNA